jgi:uncharacterized protein with HEPN domain
LQISKRSLPTKTEESFAQSRLAQKAVMMTLINIAELSKSFSEEYRLATSSIPWKEIRGLRNIAAHQYEIIRPANIWLTITQDCACAQKRTAGAPAGGKFLIVSLSNCTFKNAPPAANATGGLVYSIRPIP